MKFENEISSNRFLGEKSLDNEVSRILETGIETFFVYDELYLKNFYDKLYIDVFERIERENHIDLNYSVNVFGSSKVYDSKVLNLDKVSKKIVDSYTKSNTNIDIKVSILKKVVIVFLVIFFVLSIISFLVNIHYKKTKVNESIFYMLEDMINNLDNKEYVGEKLNLFYSKYNSIFRYKFLYSIFISDLESYKKTYENICDSLKK